MSNTLDASSFYGAPRHQPYTLGDSPNRALLLHGFPGTPAELRGVAERLASHGWQASVPLLPGFGLEIPTLGEKRWQDWRDAALSHWQALQKDAQKTLLIGFSMGGAVALHVAATQPPDTLVLIAPFWKMNDWRTALLPVVKRVMPTLKPFAKADFTDASVRKQFEQRLPGVDLDNPQIQAQLRKEIVLPTSSVDELRKLGRSAYRVAKRVHAPTLVLQGFQDVTVKPADTRDLITQLSGPVTLHEFEGTHELIKPHGSGHETLLNLLQASL